MTDLAEVTTRPAALVGQGRLYAALAPQAVPSGPELADLTAETMVLVAGDTWDTSQYRAVHAACVAAGASWLPVRAELGHVLIGPITTPGETGCFWCAEQRRDTIRPTSQRLMLDRHGERLATTPSPILGGFATETVAALVAAELAAGDRTRRALLRLDLTTLAVSRHPFLPVPLCPDCGQAPDDSAELVRITLRPRPKPAPGVFRVRDLTGAEDDLRARYVDAECGLISVLEEGGHGSLASAAASLAEPGDRDSGFGRASDYRSARLTAIAEALERHGGAPRGKRTVVHGSHRDLAADALDPRTLGLYPDHWYDQPDFPCRRYHEDLPLHWVWGHSFARSAPVLVPADYAYYRAALDVYRKPGEGRKGTFAYEISNGCALGGCLEEAIMYGLLELVERDAFLLTWFARLAVPELDLRSTGSPLITQLTDRLLAEDGYRVRAFDTTMEHGIPSFWVTALDQRPSRDRPLVLCAAGAHLNPETGLRNALHELGPLVEATVPRYPALRERAAQLAADSALVRVMDDHSLTYQHPDARHRLDFLLDNGTPPVPFTEDRWTWPVHRDLSDDLRELLSRFLDSGLDVVVVDQTTDEHRAGGFSCVKVIVPGLVPMTFGHHLRRVHGLPRLYQAPTLLGHRDRALTEADLNPDPHPFP